MGVKLWALLPVFCVAASLAGEALPEGAPRPRVALVLSGGSALGIAHIGAIRELEKAGIPIDMVLGTSMGAIVGGLYASGYSPDRMEALVEGLDWNALFTERRETPGDRYDFLKRERFPLALGFDNRGVHLGQGLLEGEGVLTLLTTLTLHVLPVRNFDELPVPYRAIAADILTGEKVVFSSGSIVEAMRSSMSIPGIFRPYEARGHLLIDGGISDDMPVDVAREMGADIVIAVESRRRLATSAAQLSSAVEISRQTMGLFMEENLRPSRAGADLLIRPDLSGYNYTSYAEAEALIRRGEAGVQSMKAEVAALASRIAATRLLPRPDEQANRRAMRDTPLLDRIEVEAAGKADEDLASACFGPLVGKRLDRAALQAAIAQAYGAGDYDRVAFDLLPASGSEDRAVGLVSMKARAPMRDSLNLALGFHGLYSAFSSSEVSIMPAVYFGEPSGPDSAFFAEAGLGARTRAYAEYFQPFGRIFLLPYLKYESTYDSFPIGEGLGLRAYFRGAGGGGWLGLGLGRRADVEAGWSLEAIRSSGISDPSASGTGVSALADSSTGALNFAFRAEDRPSLAFPERGAWVLARGRWADPSFLGDTSFYSAQLELGCAIPISRLWTLGLSSTAATDFAGFIAGAVPIPADRRFTLHVPGMFYGLEPRPERESGDHAIGAGAELRVRLGRLNPILGGDLFALANLSVGAVRVEGDPDTDFLPLRWNPSLGIGARVSPYFGGLVAVGVVVDDNALAPIRLALSLELGSLTDFLEDFR